MSLGDVLQRARIDSPEPLRAVSRFLAALVLLFHDDEGAAKEPNEPAVGEEKGAHDAHEK